MKNILVVILSLLTVLILTNLSISSDNKKQTKSSTSDNSSHELEQMVSSKKQPVKLSKICGKVLNTANEPIAGVTVSITIPSKTNHTIKANTAKDGSYILNNIPSPGPYFIETSSTNDGKYLAGGTRRAILLDKEISTIKDIIISARPSDKAIYVGTSVCVNCHNKVTPEITAKHAASAHMRILSPGQSQIIDPVGGWGANNDPVGKDTGIMTAPPDGSNGPVVPVIACQKDGVMTTGRAGGLRKAPKRG